MRTAMHQAAFPGEDISDRPLPETVVPATARACLRPPPPQRPLPGRGCDARRDRHGRSVAVMSAHRRLPRPSLTATSRRPDDRTRTGPPEERGLAPGRGPAAGRHADDGSPTRRFRDLPAPRARRPVRRQQLRHRSPRRSTRRCADADRWSCTLATGLDDGTWVVELRTAPDARARRSSTPRPGERAARRRRTAHAARALPARPTPRPTGSRQPALARRRHAATSPAHLARYGRPIAYGYLDRQLPARRLPDGLRHRPRQRRDAVGRAAVHAPTW